MTDEAERKVRQWAMRINGQPLTNRDIVELVLAVDEDADARHRQMSAAVDVMRMDHDKLADRVGCVERQLATTPCSADVERIVHDDHERMHSAHMQSDHGAEDESKLRTFYMWTLGGKLSSVILAVLTSAITAGLMVVLGLR